MLGVEDGRIGTNQRVVVKFKEGQTFGWVDEVTFD